MLGERLAQAVNVELAGTDFPKLAARLSLLVDDFEIERNGLGYNNLIFMAVVLSELAKNADAAFRSLIVEEPEAHLHPQLQAVLLRYLSSIDHGEPDEKPVQVFVTSHSPNFASIAQLESITCLVDAGNRVEIFHPRAIKFDKGSARNCPAIWT
jgi:putative ATP-dependent endonuclease of OLD family